MTSVIIGVLVLGWLVYRQLQTRAVKEDSAARLVLILAVIGIVETVTTVKKAHVHAVPGKAVAILVAGVVVGAAFGAIRAMTVRVWRDEAGVAWRRGGFLTAALWIVSLGVHLLGDVLLDHNTSIKGLGTSTIMIYLAVTLGVQRELVRARAAKLPLRSATPIERI